MNRKFIIEFNINDEDYPKEVERLRELKINPIEEHDSEIRTDERIKTVDEFAKFIDEHTSDYGYNICLDDNITVLTKEFLKGGEEYMTRLELLKLINESKYIKFTHRFFDSNEWLEKRENGNIYDENGYLFETFDEDDTIHCGLRMRRGDFWENDWTVLGIIKR